mgnify:CR=1 FL=1
MNEKVDIKTIHKFLNRIWDIAQKLLSLLKNNGIEVSNIHTSFNNYILIDQEYEKQKYPLPCIFLRRGGEILIQLDGIYVTVAVYKSSINIEFLNDLIKEIDVHMEIFGGRHFLKTFYDDRRKAETVDRILHAIEASDEAVIQVSISVPMDSWRDIVGSYIKLEKILQQHQVNRVAFM